LGLQLGGNRDRTDRQTRKSPCQFCVPHDASIHFQKVLCNEFSFLINRISPTTLRAKDEEKMVNIQCELAPKIDRPPKRVVQQRPVHLGFFQLFVEKRTEMPGIRNLNSK
jgi:hypothetical protein